MGGRRKEISEWFEIFPISDAFTKSLDQDPRAVLLVDVGGSHGHDLIQFKKRYPQLPGRLIVQDLPETLISLHTPSREIEWMEYDFFHPQPVQGKIVALLYVFFSAILFRGQLRRE